jgi:hypothetical protein
VCFVLAPQPPESVTLCQSGTGSLQHGRTSLRGSTAPTGVLNSRTTGVPLSPIRSTRPLAWLPSTWNALPEDPPGPLFALACRHLPHGETHIN